MSFRVYLSVSVISFSIMPSRYTSDAPNVFFSMSRYIPSHVNTPYPLSIHPFIDKHLGCVHILTIVNNA